MPVQQVRSSATKPTANTVNHAADLKTAPKLKGAIQEVLKRVRFGNPIPADQAPKTGTKGEWRAPNGDRLIRVVLSEPPRGMADGMTTVGLVNPKTNEFYQGTFGGIAGLRQFHGPMQLGSSVKFKDTSFSAKEIDELTAAANAKPSSGGNGLTPSKTTILNALGAYEFHHMVKWGTKAPKASDVLKQVPLKKDNHPDGYTYTGLVLKSDPHKVIIQRSGGFAGITNYSQPLDTMRLPK
jgi:hypothetical protein